MSSPIVISDDDDYNSNSDYELTSDEDVKPVKIDEDLKSNKLVEHHENVKTVKDTKIMGIVVSLPVQPYPSQIAIMSNVLKAVINKQNCLVNSPTGTGKTLALLGATLAWQKNEIDTINKDKENNSVFYPTQAKQGNGGKDSFPSPVKMNIDPPDDLFSKRTFGKKSIYDAPTQEQAPTYSNYGNKNTYKRMLNISQEEQNEAGLVTIYKKQKTKIVDLRRSPTSQGSPNKNQTTGTVTEDLMQAINEVAKCQQGTSTQVCSEPVIYYGSRTHKQIEQVVKEFKRTPYSKDASMSILSSRDNSCLREFDKILWKSKNEMCKSCTKTTGASKDTTDCAYYDNHKTITTRTLPKAFDLNELLDIGKELTACPYYAAKEMAKTANIVFCPYNYLINSGIRKNMKIVLENNIVIIDEGHNIESICRETGSCIFKREEFNEAIKELERAGQFVFANSRIMDHIQIILAVLHKLVELWFDDKDKIDKLNEKPIDENNEMILPLDIEDFVECLNKRNVGSKKYTDFSKHVVDLIRIVRDDPKTFPGSWETVTNLLESLDTVFDFLFKDNGKYKNDFKPILIRKFKTNNFRKIRKVDSEKELENASLLLHLICLNPAVIFESLLRARTVILASGTLDPISSLESELGAKFLYKVQPTPNFCKENVWLGRCAGAQMDFTRAGRTRGDTQRALGGAVLRVCRLTPHGVLVFLPSYQFVDTLVNTWKGEGIWEELEKLKYIFTEKKNMEDHEANMQEYCSRAMSDAKGALLLAVYRGKVSEGMDFPDQLARAVIAVGIPYPHQYDITVKEKMTYNQNNRQVKQLLGGSEWYTIQAYRALNQALGRCVRHQHDWGAVLLVDRRHGDNDYRNLPKWIQARLSNTQNSKQDDYLSGLKEFMDRKKKEGI